VKRNVTDEALTQEVSVHTSPISMHRRAMPRNLGDAPDPAPAPRAGAMFGGDDLNRKGYPKNPGHPKWLRPAYVGGVL